MQAKLTRRTVKTDSWRDYGRALTLQRLHLVDFEFVTSAREGLVENQALADEANLPTVPIIWP
jgi:hypothetical protein